MDRSVVGDSTAVGISVRPCVTVAAVNPVSVRCHRLAIVQLLRCGWDAVDLIDPIRVPVTNDTTAAEPVVTGQISTAVYCIIITTVIITITISIIITTFTTTTTTNDSMY